MDMVDEIKVKVKVGDIEVEVSGPPDKITDVVSEIVGKIKTSSIDKGETLTKKSGKTCKEVIEDLWREGWFREKRRLSDVYNELASRGYHFDKSAISHALSTLVKEGVLTRMGRERKYMYVQKIPSTQHIRR